MTKKSQQAVIQPITPQIKTWLNYSPDEAYTVEHPYGISETVPNEVLSPREMLEQYSRGIPLSSANREPIYSDQELPDFEKMDLVEIEEWQKENQEEIKALQDELQQAEDLQKAAEQKQRTIEEYENLKKEENKQTPPPQQPL